MKNVKKDHYNAFTPFNLISPGLFYSFLGLGGGGGREDLLSLASVKWVDDVT